MTVVHLDSCHHCERRIASGGVFCAECLAYAAEVVASLPTRPSRRMPSLSAVARHHSVDPDCCVRCGNRAPTDRAHLIDRQFDGLDNVSNLVPLCAPCHNQMPPFVPGEEWKVKLWISTTDWFRYMAAVAEGSGVQAKADAYEAAHGSPPLDDVLNRWVDEAYCTPYPGALSYLPERSTSATAAPTNRAQPAVRAGSWDGAAIGAVESERPRLVGEVERGVVRPASGASTAPTRKKNGRPSREASGQSTAPTSPAA